MPAGQKRREGASGAQYIVLARYVFEPLRPHALSQRPALQVALCRVLEEALGHLHLLGVLGGRRTVPGDAAESGA